jgi:hypothetical protein
MSRGLGAVLITLVLVSSVSGCRRDEPAGGAEVAPTPGAASSEAAPPAAETEPAAPAEPTAAEPTAPAEPAAAEPAVIDPADLHEAARVVISEYQVALVGSGTLGKGTLHFGGAEHAFRIGGLGIGGIGVAKIDAEGTVYNLNRLEEFTGVYGNARLGATAADKGAGRLWLRNPSGVVIELRSKMQGLALTGGVDGISITWDGAVKEGAREAWEDTKEGTEKAYDKTKGALKRALD